MAIVGPEPVDTTTVSRPCSARSTALSTDGLTRQDSRRDGRRHKASSGGQPRQAHRIDVTTHHHESAPPSRSPGMLKPLLQILTSNQKTAVAREGFSRFRPNGDGYPKYGYPGADVMYPRRERQCRVSSLKPLHAGYRQHCFAQCLDRSTVRGAGRTRYSSTPDASLVFVRGTRLARRRSAGESTVTGR